MRVFAIAEKERKLPERLAITELKTKFHFSFSGKTRTLFYFSVKYTCN